MQHGACAEEEQALEHGVVDGVIQPGQERQRGEHRMAAVQKHQRRAQAHQDDANVFDAVIRQQTLEVMFHERVEHAQYGGNDSDGQDRNAPPVRWGPEKVEEHASHSVNARLDQHAGHERRNVAGGHRMSSGQPNVQRHDSGLDPESRKEKEKRRIARASRHFSADCMKPVEPIST